MQATVSAGIKCRLAEAGLSQLSPELTKTIKLATSEFLVNHKRPAARDGHSCAYISANEDQPYMLVFGGDRHQMPFNDTFILDLNAELRSQGL